MTVLDGVLGELARLRHGSEPIVSLYLDVRWHDEQQRERVRLCVREKARAVLAHYAAGAPGKPALTRTLQKIQGFVEGLTGQAYEASRSGCALFACEGLKLWRPLFFARPFKDELCADGIPHLGQLAQLAEGQRPALVVVPSLEGAAIFEVRLGEVDREAAVRGAVPRSESEKLNPGAGVQGASATGGGPSRRELEREAKTERRQEEWARRNRQAAAAEVTLLFDRSPEARLILVGTAEGSAAFARELPERARRAIVAKAPLPRAWTSSGGIRRNGVRELVQALLGDGVDGSARKVETVVGEALRGSIAVVGPDDVVLAVNEGRVHELVVEEDFERRGYQCDNCGALGPDVESAEVCPFCAGDLRAVQNLREALIARTLASGGRVGLVPHENRLHSYWGVAAFLRQTAQTGLRGASPA
jgi:hypothetical protein